MSNVSATSCYQDKNDSGFSPLLLILLLCCCGGDKGFGGLFGNFDGGCSNGLGGLLPIILIMCLCGGSF